jgi:uncharacterized protein (TIGR02147 family)
MSIFNYKDYRHFIRQTVESFPKSGRGEWARLAEHLGVNATMISQVLSGSKDFSIEQAQKVGMFFGLQKMELDYFILFVQIERAGTHELKTYYKEKQNDLKKSALQVANRIVSERPLTDLERSVFYSSKFYSAIHLYCSINEGATVESLLQKFKIPRNRILEILQFLVSTGLCKHENGRYLMHNQSTHVEKGSPFLLKHHSNWRMEAVQKCEQLTDEELMFTANISLSKEDFPLIRESLVAMIQKLTVKIKDSPAEEIANLNIDFFWI